MYYDWFEDSTGIALTVIAAIAVSALTFGRPCFLAPVRAHILRPDTFLHDPCYEQEIDRELGILRQKFRAEKADGNRTRQAKELLAYTIRMRALAARGEEAGRSYFADPAHRETHRAMLNKASPFFEMLHEYRLAAPQISAYILRLFPDRINVWAKRGREAASAQTPEKERR